MRTPITYWGGKQQLAPKILPLIPAHVTYVEPFFGGGAVFFQKEKSEVEIINDLNRFVVNFYRVAQTEFDALREMIQATPHSRARYADAVVMYESPHLFDDVERAWAFWCLANQSYSGNLCSGWAYGTTGDATEKRLDNKREAFDDELRVRLARVQIECTDALRIIEYRDRPTTFFYVDPPYFNSDMGHYGGYSEADFEALLVALGKIEGKFLLSSYPSDALKKHVASNSWHQIELTMKTQGSTKRKAKTEVLTANYPIHIVGK